MALRDLSVLEARVLAVLVEKQHTVPDSYPMSLNALTLGCNQKTARDPVMNVAESAVLQALDELKAMALVNEVSGSRVVRFEHNFKRVYGIPGQAEALLTLLMLRGPQTPAELRLHTERLHRFADISAVEGFLVEMAEREPSLATKLPRAPGAREQRWTHLVSGAASLPVAQSEGIQAEAGGAHEIEVLRAEQRRMREELDALKTVVARLTAELGLDTAAESAG
ncbi:MAG: YceH family protein [Burkholderiaceae bacterium]|nr:YceH family protein [Roseateles sp.]MBV8469730.1 YceH family protein [Burkholderiaceae bacterium]